jgi:serine protease AprX
MRPSSLRLGACALLASLLGAAALAVPAIAEAKKSKVDRGLAAAAESAPPATELRVIVYGNAKKLKAVAEKGKMRIKKQFRLVDAASATVSAAGLEELANDPDVEYIAPDLPVQPTTAGAPVSFPLLSTLYPQVDGASTAWSRGYTGAGIGVAVIDSGVAASADFGSRLFQVQLNGQTSIADTYGHGTFVAGVVGGVSADGRYVGIAPGASIYAVNVNDTSGVFTSNVILGLDWVDANRQTYNIRVVNISMSETSESSYLSSSLNSAVERLWQHGVVVVVSAGNLGAGTAVYAPGNDPFVITVGAVDNAGTLATGDDRVATFSSSGTTRDGFSKPDLLAPGRQVPSILPVTTTLGLEAPLANLLAPGYATMNGTSFAAPQVAGVAALLLQQHPEWTPDQVKWLLAQTGRSLSGSGRALDIQAAIEFSGTVGVANQGITPAPQPTAAASTDTSLTSNTSSWNTSSWNTSSWNTSSWNFGAWD